MPATVAARGDNDPSGAGIGVQLMTTHDASSTQNPAIVANRSLVVRLIILVLIAIFPAILIQVYNDYQLRKAREADIRQQVVQITKQFGEEIGELREGARQLLLALSQLPAVRLGDGDSCSEHFTALKSQYANYKIGRASCRERV